MVNAAGAIAVRVHAFCEARAALLDNQRVEILDLDPAMQRTRALRRAARRRLSRPAPMPGQICQARETVDECLRLGPVRVARVDGVDGVIAG